MRQECPTTTELVGSVYGFLLDWQKEKLEVLVRATWESMPDDDLSLFIRGVLTGILLNELTFIIMKAARDVPVAHPSTSSIAFATTNIGLLVKQRINCNILPFIDSCLEDSHKDVFSSGLAMGLFFTNHKK